MDCGPQVIAFEFGRDVMERLRGAHPAVSAVMEIMLTDIGACSPLDRTGH